MACELKEGQAVIPSQFVQNCPKMIDQLTKNTGLTGQQVCGGSLKVLQLNGDKAQVGDEVCGSPCTVHTRFLAPAQPQA